MSKAILDDCSCPACCGKVEVHSSELTCTRCGLGFTLRNDVIDFRLSGHDYYKNPVSRDEMRDIIMQMPSRPWSDTLNDFLQLSGDIPLWLDEITDEGRYAWKIFLALRPGMTLLDFGCGLGTSTKSFAPFFARTYATDPTFENTSFTRRRLDIFNSSDDIDVIACSGDSRLPFGDQCIDVAIASNALDAIGQSDNSDYAEDGVVRRLWSGLLLPRWKRDPGLHQLALLREMSRVIKQDGELFIRCKNRMNYRYFASTVASNPGKSAIFKLPRKLIYLVSRVALRRNNETYENSINGYRKLFKKAGFPCVDFVAFDHDDDLREKIRPGPGRFPLWAPPPVSGWKRRIKKAAYFAPSFGIIARKGAFSRPRLEDAVVDQIVQEIGVHRQSFRAKHYLVSPKGKLIIRAHCGEDELFIRLPMTEHADKCELHNHSTLRWLKVHRSAMAGLFPTPLAKGKVLSQNYFVESSVRGTPIIDLLKRKSSLGEILDLGFSFLTELNVSSTVVPSCIDEETLQRKISEPLSSFASLITSDEIKRLEEFFATRLENVRLALGLQHGDFSIRNILVRKRAISGLLDWEDSDSNGIPALDAICLTLSCFRVVENGVPISDSIVGLARRQDYCRLYLRKLELYYDLAGVDTDSHEALVFMYWINIMSNHIKLGRTVSQTESGKFVRQMVSSILD